MCDVVVWICFFYLIFFCFCTSFLWTMKKKIVFFLSILFFALDNFKYFFSYEKLRSHNILRCIYCVCSLYDEFLLLLWIYIGRYYCCSVSKQIILRGPNERKKKCYGRKAAKYIEKNKEKERVCGIQMDKWTWTVDIDGTYHIVCLCHGYC